MRRNTKGFTLMEMLIVVAIIAVLAAIAIPSFNTSLNKARVAADESSIRAGYASLMALILTEEPKQAKTSYYLLPDCSVESTGNSGAYKRSYKTKGNANAAVSIGGNAVGPWSSGRPVIYRVTYDAASGEMAVRISFNAAD